MKRQSKGLKVSGFCALIMMSVALSSPSWSAEPQKTVKEKTMQLRKSGSEPSAKGPEDYFTGNVRIDAPFKGIEPSRVNGATVTFEPGARTAWHTHPLGQTLVVTAGRGWAQVEGSPIQEINAGDIISFPPNVRHWHGATPITGMTHIAIHEALEGKMVDWFEKVSDEQYKN
jgi:quercetin dioxygenase-like cupin family protein